VASSCLILTKSVVTSGGKCNRLAIGKHRYQESDNNDGIKKSNEEGSNVSVEIATEEHNHYIINSSSAHHHVLR